jgi:hypothetical protein
MRISIDRLELRLTGVPSHVARAAIAELGPELHRQWAEQAPRTGGPRRHIDQLNVGTVSVAAATPLQVRRGIADAVARALANAPSRPTR